MECRRWFKGEEGATDGLQPGDEFIIPIGLGWPRDGRESVERTEVVIAVKGEAAMTHTKTLIPCMYNPVFRKTGNRLEGALIAEDFRRQLLAIGWSIER